MQFLGRPSPVVPRMAEKDVARVRQGRRSLLEAPTDRRECPHLGRRVRHRRTGWRPARPCAAAGPASAAPATAAAPRRGVGRGGARLVAAVATVATIAAGAATACRAGRFRARCAVAIYWCRASSHVADDTGYHRPSQALVQSGSTRSASARMAADQNVCTYASSRMNREAVSDCSGAPPWPLLRASRHTYLSRASGWLNRSARMIVAHDTMTNMAKASAIPTKNKC